MPFTSSAGNFFSRFGPATSNVPSGQSGIDSIVQGAKFQTPNLFDTIQAVRQNELDRQVKQVSITKALQEIQQAPIEQEVKQAQLRKALYDLDPNNFDRQAKMAELVINEQKAMAQSGLAPTTNTNLTREELLMLSPEDRRKSLGSRTGYGVKGTQVGKLTGNRYAPTATVGGIDTEQNPDIMLAGYDTKGRPFYRSRSYGEFQRGLVTENPSIDLDTQKAISAVKFAQPKIQNVTRLIDSGALGDDKTFKKFVNEIRVLGAGPTLRYTVQDGSPLEGLVSELNSLRVGGFGIAGTAYTDTEREIIEYGLDPRGKSLSQIKSDINIVQDLMIEKARSGTMGLKEARDTVSQFKTFRESGVSSGGVPEVGQTYNGEKVLKVTKVS